MAVRRRSSICMGEFSSTLRGHWIGWLAFAPLITCASTTSIAAEAQLPTHQQALAVIHGAQLASPYRLSEKARAGRIRYTLRVNNESDWNWPQTAEQKVSRKDGNVLITVCADCGVESPPDPASLSRYLAPNRWVDSDSSEVIAFARANAYGIRVRGARIARQMRMLVKAIPKHMEGGIDFRAYASASEALESHSGDCTEYAVLLAATARARGIPTRLVYGLAYASRFTGESNVFSPHMWVQVWDGKRWTSYDAGLGKFDSGHIALFIGDGRIEPLGRVTQFMQHLDMIDAVGVKIADRPAPGT